MSEPECATEAFECFVIAKRLATFGASHLCMEDLGKADSDRRYIRPDAHVSSMNTSVTPRYSRPAKSTRFESVLRDVTPPVDETAVTLKISYTIANQETLSGRLKNGRPIKVVTLSSNP